MSENKAQRCREVRQETFDEGVIMNILCRLPVKSLCRFKSVSKFWYGMISDKYFAKIQLAESRENPNFITCPSPSADMRMTLYSMRPGSSNLFQLNRIVAAERNYRGGHEQFMYMVSSFNGLICCVNAFIEEDVGSEFCDMQIWICNPCTRETLLLPQGTPSYRLEPSVGVTYASDTSDYKVFRIYCAGKKIPEKVVSSDFLFRNGDVTTNSPANAYECEVYSSITGSWKNIGPVPRAPMGSGRCLHRSSHAFVGGKLFWHVHLDQTDGILSIDSEGRCEELKLPHLEWFPDCTFLTFLQGSLTLVIVGFRCITVWVWKEEVNDWSKLRKISKPYHYYDEHEFILAVTTLNNQILITTDTSWWKYDVDTEAWNRVIGPLSGFTSHSVFPFTESLLPCKGGVML